MTESPIDVLGRPESTRRSEAEKLAEARRRLDVQHAADGPRGLIRAVRELIFGR